MSRLTRSKKNHGQPSSLRDPNIQIVFGVSLMVVLGVSVITPAFPSMIRELGISSGDVALLISVFTLPMVVSTLFFGVLADRFGRKKILVPSLLLFGIAGVACSFARDFRLLLALRFLQGFGGASFYPLSVTVICDLYSGQGRAAILGYHTSINNVGHAAFPVIGGALAMVGWYYPFLLSAMAVPLGLIVLFSLTNPEPTKGQDIREYLGNVWRIVRSQRVVPLFFFNTMMFVIIFGCFMTYFPLLLGNTLGATPFVIGLLMASRALGAALASSQMSRLTASNSPGRLMKASFVLYAGSLLSIPFLPNLWLLLVPTLMLGVAHGIFVPSYYSLIADMSPMNYRAAFMSMDETLVRLGQTVGPLLMVVVFGVLGFSGVFFAGAALSIAMLVLAIFLR